MAFAFGPYLLSNALSAVTGFEPAIFDNSPALVFLNSAFSALIASFSFFKFSIFALTASQSAWDISAAADSMQNARTGANSSAPGRFLIFSVFDRCGRAGADKVKRRKRFIA